MTQVTSVNILEFYDCPLCPNEPFGGTIIDPCTLHSYLISCARINAQLHITSSFRSLARSPPDLLFAFFFRCSNFKISDRRKPGNSPLHEGEHPPVPTPFLPPRRPRRTVQTLRCTVLPTSCARARRPRRTVPTPRSTVLRTSHARAAVGNMTRKIGRFNCRRFPQSRIQLSRDIERRAARSRRLARDPIFV
jgi:hypothetical protein